MNRLIKALRGVEALWPSDLKLMIRNNELWLIKEVPTTVLVGPAHAPQDIKQVRVLATFPGINVKP